MRKSERHAIYTIEERNEIVKKYLNGEMGYSKITRFYDLSSKSTLHYWVKKYKEHGAVIDKRGRSSVGKGIYSRRKKLIPEQMSREELIEYVKANEDIKKFMAFLKKQEKNINSNFY